VTHGKQVGGVSTCDTWQASRRCKHSTHVTHGMQVGGVKHATYVTCKAWRQSLTTKE